MESAAFKAKFMKQINSSFGSGGMGLALSEVEFASFIMFLKSRDHIMPTVLMSKRVDFGNCLQKPFYSVFSLPQVALVS